MKQTTKQMELHPRGWLAGLCSVAMIVGLAPAGVAQQVANGQAAAASRPVVGAAAKVAAKPAAEEEEEASAPKKKGGEGIRVHGHWIMDVRNSDGTLVEHKDFQNSLVGPGASTSGDQALLAVLSGNMSMGDPGIAFVSTVSESGVIATDPSTYCFNFPAASTSGVCSILTTNSSSYAGSNWKNSEAGLSSVAMFGTTGNKWVLSGNWVVPSGMTSVLYVQTIVSGCVSLSGYAPILGPSGTYPTLSGSLSSRTGTTTPAACYTGNPAFGADSELTIFPFTSTLVPGEPPTGMPVTPGQTVTVTVTLSFS